MDELILRELDEEDAQQAAAICKKCFGKNAVPRKSYLANVAYSWRHIYFVAELDGKIVACMGAEVAEYYEDYYEAKKDTARIEVVAVDPDYHSRGIGTKLFAKLLAELEDSGVQFMWLTVHPSNTPAIEFYEHFGFESGHIRDRFPGDEGIFFMTRSSCTDDSDSEQ